mmetsp:Transcript_159280/g.297080  ORF Transcript_159280/g.297080 Transcript_159280/m.297080 type:complete len:1182 (-) Transcript_159280:130-3675(-)
MSSEEPMAENAGKPLGKAVASKLKAQATMSKPKAKDKDAPQDSNHATSAEHGPEDDANRSSLNRQTLEEFHLAPEIIRAAQGAWNQFIAISSNKEIAGEALYTALFEAAPTWQNLFTSPRAVAAMKFMNGIHALILNMEDHESLHVMVETLGFQHLHLEVTPPRVVVFRDAILDLLQIELGEQFTAEAREGLAALLNYVGGALIFVRTNYADRLRLLKDSWAIANGSNKAKQQKALDRVDSFGSSEGSEGSPKQKSPREHGSHEKDRHKMKNKVFKGKGGNEEDQDSEDGEKGGGGFSSQALPTTFAEMFDINSAVMGFKDRTWMSEVVESFDGIVSNVQNSGRLKEEAEVLSLMISKCIEDGADVQLPEFKACMLAALRSLLPKTWSTQHEVAWTWMWENVARLLVANMSNPPIYEAALGTWMEGMNEDEQYEWRKMIYNRFFEHAPAGQNFFKQSNTRLHYIAEQMIAMTRELYRNPRQMVARISALGLRHVEFGIPTELFAPFVTSFVEVVRDLTTDEVTIAAFRWSLALIAKILVRTITEGSTVVMKAINANSLKALKTAINAAPRSERAKWLLSIQVGTQSISPLSWAIESGSLDVAKEIIVDLLTFRADRANYYYGVDELFGRHPDITKRLVEDASMLLPTFLEGLIWRSHRPEKGMRRCNYYVKHLLVGKTGQFADSLKWLAATGEPAIIAQPVVVLVSDTLWTGVVYLQFLRNKVWWIFNLAVFMCSQGVLLHYVRQDLTDQTKKRLYSAIFACRMFIYVLGLGKLAFFHLSRIWTWSRMTMKRIFDEIDQDGSGTIEFAELLEASAAFKASVQDEIRKALRFLRDDDGPATMEDAKKAIATQSKNMVNIISFMLMLLLVVMAFNEPMLWCSRVPEWPTDTCAASDDLRYRYSILSMAALVIHWLMLVDLAVFSTEISAFLLVCGHVMSEVRQFLTALSFLLLTFGSAIPIFCQDCPEEAGNFENMPRAIVSLFAITLGWFEADDVMEIKEGEPMLLVVLLVFVGLSVILLLNLLIAQLNRSYEYIYQDMLGFARLNRASLIVDAMMGCSASRWRRFIEELNFDKPVEFDPGDLGPPGGIQVLEPQGLHNVLEERIVRFGGSTSPDIPWPEDKNGIETEEERFDRLETLITKAMKRISKNGGKKAGNKENRSGNSGSGDAGSGASEASRSQSN